MKQENTKNRIGFMQGRLSEPVDNKIQAFPIHTWEKEFKWAKNIDIKNMEWTIDYQNILQNPLMQKNGRDKINFLKEKYDLKIPSITCDCFMQQPFWKESNPENNKKLINLFFNLVQACKIIDCRIIVLPLVDNGKLEKKKEEKYLIDFLKDNIDFIKDNNVQIAFEIDYEPKKIAIFLENLNTNFFGINYDIGNSASLGFEPDQEFYNYGDRIFNVHIKDRKYRGCTVPLGEGNANIPLVLSLLSKYKYKGNFIFQTARTYKGNHINLMQEYYINLLEALKIC